MCRGDTCWVAPSVVFVGPCIAASDYLLFLSIRERARLRVKLSAGTLARRPNIAWRVSGLRRRLSRSSQTRKLESKRVRIGQVSQLPLLTPTVVGSLAVFTHIVLDLVPQSFLGDCVGDNWAVSKNFSGLGWKTPREGATNTSVFSRRQAAWGSFIDSIWSGLAVSAFSPLSLHDTN